MAPQPHQNEQAIYQNAPPALINGQPAPTPYLNHHFQEPSHPHQLSSVPYHTAAPTGHYVQHQYHPIKQDPSGTHPKTESLPVHHGHHLVHQGQIQSPHQLAPKYEQRVPPHHKLSPSQLVRNGPPVPGYDPNQSALANYHRQQQQQHPQQVVYREDPIVKTSPSKSTCSPIQHQVGFYRSVPGSSSPSATSASYSPQKNSPLAYQVQAPSYQNQPHQAGQYQGQQPSHERHYMPHTKIEVQYRQHGPYQQTHSGVKNESGPIYQMGSSDYGYH